MARLNEPEDVLVQADILAWAELKTAAEVARAELLEGKGRSSNESVRLENLTRRAAISVGLESTVGEAAPLSMADTPSARRRGCCRRPGSAHRLANETATSIQNEATDSVQNEKRGFEKSA
jgi:hypothetical protein